MPEVNDGTESVLKWIDGSEGMELRPYPNEHAARLINPNRERIRVRRTNGSGDGTVQGIKVPATIAVIWYIIKTADGKVAPIAQALRFPIKNWTESEARKWLKDNKIKYILFEPAAEKKSEDDSDIEYRFIQKAELSVRGDDGKKKIVGYPVVFNSLSREMWGFKERVMPGAFKRTLAEGADVRALINHNASLILGRNKAGTLTLKEDDHGLHSIIDPPDTTAAKDIIESISRGDVDGMSFSFRSVDERWLKEGGINIREILDADLFDVAIVTYPAYPATEVMIRSLPQTVKELSGIIIRAERGCDLTPDDRSVIDVAIIRLQNLKHGITPVLDERRQKLEQIKKS